MAKPFKLVGRKNEASVIINLRFFLEKLNPGCLRVFWRMAVHIHSSDSNKICQSLFKVGEHGERKYNKDSQ